MYLLLYLFKHFISYITKEDFDIRRTIESNQKLIFNTKEIAFYVCVFFNYKGKAKRNAITLEINVLHFQIT